ncbi:DNA alkylation repair protein [Actinoplanes sp. NPDC051513]|uniref:DNA alkylation repair protein n=1 Tax=Actinoplanes sp. NPDC051513 TaxID=3363908 RepID=UPI003799D4BD
MLAVTDLAGTLLGRLDADFSVRRDPERAAAMAAYMRDQFEYFGLAAPAVRAVERSAFAGLPRPTADDLRAVTLGCWERDEREFQYAACDYLRKFVSAADPGFVPVLRTLITTKSWWDTVDPLATRVTGDLVRAHPALVGTMDAWSADENMWLVRTALLFQLHYGEATDTERLFEYCARQAGHRDFFVRKAIGWALRHYARTDASAVRAFVETTPTLSGLSRREAMKHL